MLITNYKGKLLYKLYKFIVKCRNDFMLQLHYTEYFLEKIFRK